MSAVRAAEDPTRYLSPPVPQGSGQFITQLRISAGPIVGAGDWFASTFMGFSPLAEWVAKPLGGDWEAMDKAADAWRNTGRALGAVSSNIGALPGQVGDSWNGASKDKWAALQAKLVQEIGPLPDACVAMGEFASALAEMARAIAELIGQALEMLAEEAVCYLIDLAIPVVGEVIAAAETPVFVARTLLKARDIMESIKTFLEVSNKVKDPVERIKDVLTILAALAHALQAANAAVEATNRISDPPASAGVGAGAGSSGVAGSGGGAGGGW
jgi:uncharacterized protein YukE